MLETIMTRQFELKAPIINAGMAFVAGPELAAAVANAGGLGMLGGAMVPPEGLRAMNCGYAKHDRKKFRR
jgi:NAD(P)H-dependent flavin oxidoreductase YrpB (nitropropane dioxygenase family)